MKLEYLSVYLSYTSFVTFVDPSDMSRVELNNPFYAGIFACGANSLREPMHIVVEQIFTRKEGSVPKNMWKIAATFRPVGMLSFLRFLAGKQLLEELCAYYAEPILRLIALMKLLSNSLAILGLPRN